MTRLTVGLATGLIAGLIAGLTAGLACGIEIGLPLGIGLYLGFLRIFLWLFYQLRHWIKPYTLQNNPHWFDGSVLIPIAGIDWAGKSYEQPLAGERFAEFLLTRRKHQRKLALEIQYAAYAGYWKHNRLTSQILEKHPMILEDKTGGQLSPSRLWLSDLSFLRYALLDYEKEIASYQAHPEDGARLDLILAYLHTAKSSLLNLLKQTLHETTNWKKYYAEALTLWAKEADRLEIKWREELRMAYQYGGNIYRRGNVLSPNQLDKRVFFGRESLQKTLKDKVLSVDVVPMFFIQGQRRIGKTSLISFLSDYLGSRFCVVLYDFQYHAPASIQAWLMGLLATAKKDLGSPVELPVELATHWAEAWLQAASILTAMQQAADRTLIFALDEYEHFHYKLLQQDPQAADALLGAMRGFTQHQQKVVLLFSGADLFTELRSPNWNEYFGQATRLPVDYLQRADTYKLIEAYVHWKTPEHFPETVKGQFYHWTQGHPQLSQELLSDLVEESNRRQNPIVSAELLAEIVETALSRPDSNVVSIFWQQFCANRNAQPTVLRIVERQPLSPEDDKAIYQLSLHGFILQDETQPSGYRLRVPFFEAWLQRYARLVM